MSQHLQLLQRGIATFDGDMYVFSAAHTERDVDRTLEALDDPLDAMMAEGSIPQALMLKWPAGNARAAQCVRP